MIVGFPTLTIKSDQICFIGTSINVGEIMQHIIDGETKESLLRRYVMLCKHDLDVAYRFLHEYMNDQSPLEK